MSRCEFLDSHNRRTAYGVENALKLAVHRCLPPLLRMDATPQRAALTERTAGRILGACAEKPGRMMWRCTRGPHPVPKCWPAPPTVNQMGTSPTRDEWKMPILNGGQGRNRTTDTRTFSPGSKPHNRLIAEQFLWTNCGMNLQVTQR